MRFKDPELGLLYVRSEGQLGSSNMRKSLNVTGLIRQKFNSKVFTLWSRGQFLNFIILIRWNRMLNALKTNPYIARRRRIGLDQHGNLVCFLGPYMSFCLSWPKPMFHAKYARFPRGVQAYSHNVLAWAKKGGKL